jgi:hypothetical protein
MQTPMKSFFNYRLLPLLLALSTVPNIAAADADPVQYDAQYVQLTNEWAIKIRFLTPLRKILPRALDTSKREPYEAASYELKDAQGSPISVTVDSAPADTPFVGSIFLKPATLLDGDKYTLTIKAKKLTFKLAGNPNPVILPAADTQVEVQGLKRNKAFFQKQEGFTSESSLELAGGSPGGIGSFRLLFQRLDEMEDFRLGMRLSGSADLTLDSDDREEFFNNVSGELSVLAMTGTPSETSVDPRYWELSLHAKTESDQSFDTTDGLVGLKFGIYPKDPITRWLGTVFVPTNNHIGPLIFAGYDYVHNLGGQPAASALANDINTGRADHRVAALLRWRIPLLERKEFSLLNVLDGTYNVDLDLELKGVYDINASEFMDQTRISVAFTRVGKRNVVLSKPEEESRFKPAFVFTWARGKEGPTWKEVNALLAGLKISL